MGCDGRMLPTRSSNPQCISESSARAYARNRLLSHSAHNHHTSNTQRGSLDRPPRSDLPLRDSIPCHPNVSESLISLLSARDLVTVSNDASRPPLLFYLYV